MTTTVLLSLPANTTATPVALNNSGEAVADTQQMWAIGLYEAAVLQSTSAISLGNPAGYSYEIVAGLNDAGDIVGRAYTANSPSAVYQAYAVENGAAIALSALAGTSNSGAYGINNSGEIVGTAWNAGSTTSSYAVFWQSDTSQATALGMLTGGTSAVAGSINDNGLVSGYGTTSSGATHAILWTNGIAADLGTLNGYATSSAVAVNDAGQVAGNAISTSTEHAFIWQNGTMTDLGVLSGYTSSVAMGINASGEVVGYSTTSSVGVTDSNTNHATLWMGGQVVDLNSLLPANPLAGYIQQAVSVNDYGQILVLISGGSYAAIITPSTLPGSITVPTLSSSSPSADLVDLAYAPFNPSAMKFTLTGSTLSVMEGTANLGSATLSNATGLTAANFYVVEDAHGGTEIHVSQSASAVANFSVTDTTLGTTTVSPGVVYSGPVSDLAYQYISSGSDSVNITANVANVFLHGGTGGNNALAAFAGVNVLDGGPGSNFLVGVAATASATTAQDTFYVDGRGTAAVWSTVVNFHEGDAATMWGVTSTTAIETVASAGAAGYAGLTIHADTQGNGSYSSSITLAGISASQVHETFGGGGTTGVPNYMYITWA